MQVMSSPVKPMESHFHKVHVCSRRMKYGKSSDVISMSYSSENEMGLQAPCVCIQFMNAVHVVMRKKWLTERVC